MTLGAWPGGGGESKDEKALVVVRKKKVAILVVTDSPEVGTQKKAGLLVINQEPLRDPR